VLGPVAGRGWLLILDWVHGPNHVQPLGTWGFGFPTGPVPALVAFLEGVLHGPTVPFLVIALCFPLAAWGMARLVPGGVVARAAGALLYTINPFVFERLGSGQVFVLLSYALLPFLVRALLVSERQPPGLRRLGGAVWLAVIAAPAIHFAWIGGLVLLVIVAWRHRFATLRWGVELLVVTALLDAYLLGPILYGGRSATGLAGGSADLAAFRTAGDQHWGLFVNVAGLYGFWRQGFLTLPKDHLPGWPLLLLALLLRAAVGLDPAGRADGASGPDGAIGPDGRTMVGVLVVAGALSYLLALGDQGPTGSVFRLLYDHLPGFAVLREPEKFVSVLAVTYAVGFGLGVEAVTQRLARGGSRRALAVVLVLVPLAYTPTVFDGLGGQLRPSGYPSSWAAANRMMGSGPGQILFLPWHEYLAFPFTHGQVVANPAGSYFTRTVISGDNEQVGQLESDSTSPRSAYLESLFARGPQLHEFGHLVAQLGVRYIVLADTDDAADYTWVGHQSDLQEVFDRGGLQVWRDPWALPQGARLTATMRVPTLGTYIRRAQREDLLGTAVFVGPARSPAPTAGTAPAGTGTGGAGLAGRPAPVDDVRRVSPVAYHVGRGPPGWVLLPVASDSAWRLDGRSATPLADGVVALPGTGAGGRAAYTGWIAEQIGYAISGVTLVLLGVGGLAARRRRTDRAADTHHLQPTSV
jgi:hypothetical protein